MNKDLIIGVVVSVALHSTILFLGQKSPPPKKIAPPKEEVVQFEMPPLDEEKPDKVEDLNEEPVENQLAPPSLIDLPTIVPIEAFTQPLAPPPPPGMIASGAISIPVLKPGANFGKGIANLFDINNLDQRPTPRVQPQPAYPYEMSRAGISGSATVRFIIDENGVVIHTRIIRSSHRNFEVPTLQAVRKWTFKAARKGGKAVKVSATNTLEFALGDRQPTPRELENIKNMIAQPKERPRIASASLNRTTPLTARLSGVVNVGIVGRDARWSEYGDYLNEMLKIIQVTCDRILEESRVGSPQGSHVVVTFKINAKGKTDIVKVEDADSGEQGVFSSKNAITYPQPYRAWSPQMIAALGDEQELSLAFYYQ